MKMDFSFENTELRAGRWVTREWESRVRFHSCAPWENLRAIQKGRGAVQGLMLAEPLLDPSCRPSSRSVQPASWRRVSVLLWPLSFRPRLLPTWSESFAQAP